MDKKIKGKFHSDILVVVLLIFVAIILFLPVIMKWQGIFHNDQAMSEFLHRYFFVNNLQKGVIPLWDQHVWCGANFYYSFIYTGVNYYLPVWPFYLMADLNDLGHSYWMITILPFLMHYLLAAIGMFVLLRKIIRCNCISSAVGAAVYVFSPAFMYSYTVESRLIIQSLLPWLIIIYMSMVQKQKLWKLFLGAIVFAFTWIAGVPQDMPFIIIIWSGFIFLSMIIGLRNCEERLFRRTLLPAILIFILGTTLSSVYLFSLSDGVSLMNLIPGVGSNAFLHDSSANTQPAYLITLLLPNIYGSITGHNFISDRVMFWYANMSGGIVTTFAVILGLVLPLVYFRKSSKNYIRYAILGFLLYAISVLCSLGSNTPFYQIFIGWIPIVKDIPFPPCRFRFIQCFSVSLLIAIGLNFLNKHTFPELKKFLPKIILIYIIFTFCLISIVVIFLPHSSKPKEFWIGEVNPEAEDFSADNSMVGVYTSRVARVKKIGLVFSSSERSRGEIRYADSHYVSSNSGQLVKRYDVQGNGWVEIDVDIPPNKFLWISNKEGSIGFWTEDTPCFIYNNGWVIQPHINAISLYHDRGRKNASLFSSLKNSYVEKTPVVNSLLYWFLISSILILGAWFLSPKNLGYFLGVVVVCEFLVFGTMAFYGCTFNEAQTSSREFLPHNVRAFRPSDHPMIQWMLRETFLPPGNRQLRLTTDYPFYDNFSYLRDGFSLMGEPASFLDVRFRRAIESAYGRSMSTGLFYEGGGFLPVRPEFLSNFSVGYFISSTKGKVFNEEKLISINDSNRRYLHINCNVLPRVYTINNIVFASEEEQFTKLVSDDLHKAVYVSADSSIGNTESNNTDIIYDFNEIQEKNRIKKINYDNPNKISVEVEIIVPSMLVFSEVWHPGWKSTVDDKPAEVYRVNYCQRGVWLNEGNHKVILSFKPKAWHFGMIATLVVFILMLCALVKEYLWVK